ncbi:MAG: class I SAM-dependent methyltransferase [Candidatus Geothermarchaeales archaeon]
MSLWRHLMETVRIAKQAGFRAGLERFVLGRHRYEALRDLPYVEPLLLSRPTLSDLSPLERNFVRCSDIYAFLPTLYRMALKSRRGRILELGVGSGESTIVFLAAAKEMGGHVTSVDIESCFAAQNRVKDAGLSGFWTFVQEDDLALPWNRPIDHLFIDTSHRFDHTMMELEKYERWVVPGGTLLMHDTTLFPEVWQAIETYFRGRDDVDISRYFHNNGLAIVAKASPRSNSSRKRE